MLFQVSFKITMRDSDDESSFSEIDTFDINIGVGTVAAGAAMAATLFRPEN